MKRPVGIEKPGGSCSDRICSLRKANRQLDIASPDRGFVLQEQGHHTVWQLEGHPATDPLAHLYDYRVDLFMLGHRAVVRLVPDAAVIDQFVRQRREAGAGNPDRRAPVSVRRGRDGSWPAVCWVACSESS